MKQLLFTSMVLLLTTSNAFSQSSKINFGVATGFYVYTVKNSFEDIKTTDSNYNFYAGLSGSFKINNNFNIEPQLLYYAKIDQLSLPLLAKLKIANKLNVIVGPQLFFNLKKTADDFSKININGLGGFSYEFDKNFSIQTFYSFQINNTYTGDVDIDLRADYFNIGYVFKF